MANIFYWLLAILMFGILVMLHEFGHFVAARLSGVTVLEFAVGFGPKLWSRTSKKSGVMYAVRVLPFGGYCRFAGELDDEEDDSPNAYPNAAIWKRALISVSGPLMNLLTAIVLLFVLFFAIGLPIGPVPVVGEVLAGYPAEAAGFQAGDAILEINDVDIVTAEDASREITQAEGNEITFVLERDGQRVTVPVQPAWMEEDEPTPRWMVGIQYQTGEPVRFGFFPSIGNAFRTTGNMATMILDVLKNLITKGEGIDELSGMLGTVTVVKEQTQEGGLFSYLYLAAVISVNLGLFNLLPIPGLDGSKLVFLAIEKIRGKPLDPNKEGLVTLIGLTLLVGLMALALYQDIMRLI